MGEFFNGWRRKVGCATLLLATMTGAAWGLSMLLCISIDHDVGDWQYHAHLYDGEFALWWYKPNDWLHRKNVEWFTTWGANCDDLRHYHIWFEVQRECLSGKVAGCGYINQGRENEIRPTDFAVLTLLYWQPIVPLTLLSAVLIFWSPRPKKTAVRNPDTEAEIAVDYLL